MAKSNQKEVDLLGLGLDIFTDPLTYLGIGMVGKRVITRWQPRHNLLRRRKNIEWNKTTHNMLWERRFF